MASSCYTVGCGARAAECWSWLHCVGSSTSHSLQTRGHPNTCHHHVGIVGSKVTVEMKRVICACLNIEGGCIYVYLLSMYKAGTCPHTGECLRATDDPPPERSSCSHCSRLVQGQETLVRSCRSTGAATPALAETAPWEQDLVTGCDLSSAINNRSEDIVSFKQMADY